MYCTVTGMAQNNGWFLDNWDLYGYQTHASSFFYNFKLILIKLSITRQIRSRIKIFFFHLINLQS